MTASVSKANDIPLGAFPITVPTIKYGFAIDTFQVTEGVIEPNRVFSDLLTPHGVDYPTIDKIVANANGIFDMRKLLSGKPYMILAKDEANGADYFIYEPNVYEYIVFHLKDDYKVVRTERPVQKEIRTADGVLESSLWQTMVDNGLSYELTAKMEDALQWSIDFHHLQKGDEFHLVFEENQIEGEQVGVGNVYAAYYKTGETEFYAIWYAHGDISGYYDLEGRPMKKGFLKSPVKYSRISSYFNMNRFHPILKRTRPHLGTDYAAPYGTPIYAVGDGVIMDASFTKGNGNFVKIKHDETYQTQYLHMQKFATGISRGAHVKQGQVIGYVGSTGLATGPHVCFRFWKNGKQVNHLNLSFPPPAPLPKEEMPGFIVERDKYLKMLGQEPSSNQEEKVSTESPVLPTL
ncbi:MAG: peptidoglycan DD-metalloendopeptidase family protein [Saprospirales bacterium]|nr:peptidoglycan DD-metalloendopeptidase family protein [Saprospirales bacterium]MBK8492044.1 peptidoglycan DD-metalloendopeptidase family protein [Saprospirales bacterium]